MDLSLNVNFVKIYIFDSELVWWIQLMVIKGKKFE